MIFTQSNVEVRLVGGAAEAERAFAEAETSRATLVVNATRYPSIDQFLRMARFARHAFVAGSGVSIVESSHMRVGRCDPGAAPRFDSFGGWYTLDAMLVADSFDRLTAVIDELSETST